MVAFPARAFDFGMSPRHVLRRTSRLKRTAPLGLPAGFVACFVAFSASCVQPAQASSVQSSRLTVVTLPLGADPKTNPLAAIWSDQLAALRAHVENRPVSFFTATFTDGAKTILVSVSVNDPTCENYSGALAKPTAYSSCPMRAAVLQNGAVSVVASDAHFGLPIAFDASGRFDTETGANATTLGYDSTSHVLTIAEVIDGKPATALDDIPSPIHLKY
jgi:hypothetical protein